MLKKFLNGFVATVCICAFATTIYGQDSDINSGHLFSMHGSNTVGARLGPALVEKFLRSKGLADVQTKTTHTENEYTVSGVNSTTRQWSHVSIAAHGSSTGFRALQSGEADIAMASRSIKGSEVENLVSLGDMLSFSAEHVIAIDGLAVIVHPSNPVNELTKKQIAQIFSGEIKNWSEVGGNRQAISVHARDDKSGTWDTFKSLVLGKEYSLIETAQRFESNDQLSNIVTRHSGAIGFVGLASVASSKAIAVSVPGTTPLRPEQIAVSTEDYPLSRRLFLYTSAKKKPEVVDEFLHFVQDQSGQNVVDTIGFVSQTPVALSVSERIGPHEYQELTENAQRLSINVRFSAGSAILDNKARHDIQRLVNMMSLPEYSNRQILLVGFGDAKQTQSRSKVLSKLRAVAVKSRLHENGVQVAPVAGFGAFKPVASNNGNDKLRNQRVEVWLM